MVDHYGNSLAVSYKTKHTLSADPVITLLGIYPKVKRMSTQTPIHGCL